MTSTVHLSGTLHLSDCEGDLVCFDRLTDRENGPPGCLGSLYLNWDYCYRPGHSLVPQGSIISVITRGICIFVDSHDGRDGGFRQSLVDGGHDFTHYEVDGFNWQGQWGQNPGLNPPSMYCIASDHVTLPATTTPETIHGICTM